MTAALRVPDRPVSSRDTAKVCAALPKSIHDFWVMERAAEGPIGREGRVSLMRPGD